MQENGLFLKGTNPCLWAPTPTENGDKIENDRVAPPASELIHPNTRFKSFQKYNVFVITLW